MGWGEQQGRERSHGEVVAFLEDALRQADAAKDLARALPAQQRSYGEGMADGMAEACRQVLRFMRFQEPGVVER